MTILNIQIFYTFKFLKFWLRFYFKANQYLM